MKKILFLAALLSAATTVSSQTVLWDGENYDIGSQGGCWDDGSPVVTENPDASGINTSTKCLKFTMTGDSKVVKIPFREWITPGMNGSKRVSLMIRKTTNENVQIELSDPTDGSGSYWYDVAAWYGGNGEWQKVVFDFSTHEDFDNPGVMSITAQTADVTSDEDVYIDNVVIEAAPKVGGSVLSEIGDGTLSGALTLTGTWMSGSCSKVYDGEWTENAYDDYATVQSKITSGVTSVDITGAELSYNPFNGIAPNALVYAPEGFVGEGNVIVGGAAQNEITLSEQYPFDCPEDFTAASVNVLRDFYANYNTLVLPFAVSADEIGADGIATYTGCDGETATFADTDGEIQANTPLLAHVTETADGRLFENKDIKATPENLGATYTGVYKEQSAEGLYGISDDGLTFVRGTEDSYIRPFHAYLTIPESAQSLKIEFVTDSATGITCTLNAADTENTDVYTICGAKIRSGVPAGKATGSLAKGIYIIGGKKVIVK